MKILSNVVEMAYDRSGVIRSLQNSEQQRIYNLVKIFWFRDTTTVGHWKDELFGACNDTKRLKGSNKYLPYKHMIKELWYSWEDCFQDRLPAWIDNIEYKENMTVPQFSSSNLYNFLREYHEWLAQELSSKGFVLKRSLDSQVDKLLAKYSLT